MGDTSTGLRKDAYAADIASIAASTLHGTKGRDIDVHKMDFIGFCIKFTTGATFTGASVEFLIAAAMDGSRFSDTVDKRNAFARLECFTVTNTAKEWILCGQLDVRGMSHVRVADIENKITDAAVTGVNLKWLPKDV